jgi:DNA-binding NtrC family response regulator
MRVSDATCTRTDGSARTVLVPSLQVVARAAGGTQLSAPLGMDGVVVGSGADASLVLEDPQVSRRHCEFRVTEGGVVLRDLGSKNGTWLGPVSVREVLIAPEVRVEVGGSQVWIERAGDARRLDLSEDARFGDAVGQSVAMRALFKVLEQAAPTDSTVLLLGETGTGKGLLARAIHAASPRRKGPFVVLDLAALDPGLLRSELFGYEKGAFTDASAPRDGRLAAADGGTLFIDEVGELPLSLQTTLLTALDDRRYSPVGSNRWVGFDARIIAATHQNLKKLAEEGKFRQDLYFRLGVITVRVPPLRDRKEDLPLLIERLQSRLKGPRPPAPFSPRVLEVLRAYHWPGNVRELRNVVERLSVLPDSPLDLASGDAPSAAAPREPWSAGLAELPLAEARELLQKRFLRWYLTAVLRSCDDVVTAAARHMGVGRQRVHDLIREAGLSRKDLAKGDGD